MKIIFNINVHRLIGVFTLVLVGNFNVYGQLLNPPNAINFGDLETIFNIEATDVDGDDDIDLILQFESDPKLSWIENNGNGTFVTPAKTILQGTPGYIRIGVQDLNGDDLEDLVVINELDGLLEIYFNQGGYFGAVETEFFLDENLDNVTIDFLNFDLDSNNYIDIIIGRSSELACYINIDGQGTFEKQILVNEAFINPNAVAFQDLDGNGVFEIYAAVSNFIRVFTKTAGEDFYNNWENLVSTGSGDVDLEFLDWNCDGYLDLFYSRKEEDDAFVLLSGPGGFDSDPTLVGQYLNTITEIEVADLDGDGSDDVALAGAADPLQNVILSACNGSHQLLTFDNMEFSGGTSIEIADIDGDGISDIVCCALYDNSLYWFGNTGEVADPVSSYATEVIDEFEVRLASSGELISNQTELFPMSISLFSLTGKQILTQKVDLGERINLNDLSTGLYIVKIRNLKGEYVSKKIIRN